MIFPRKPSRAAALRHWNHRARVMAGLERQAVPSILATINAATRSAAEAFARGGELEALLVADRELVALQPKMEKIYRRSGLLFSVDLREAAKSCRLCRERKADDPFFRNWLSRFITASSGTRILDIGETTKRRIQQVILRGAERGAGIEEIADEINNRSINRARALTIARTEIHIAGMSAEQAQLEDLGLLAEPQIEQEWVAVSDDRTRDAHAQADGQTVGINETFSVNGERMAYPGDENASAGNIVNCRCVRVFITND